MSKEIRKINPELAKKFLEREKKLGISIGILTVLFFLVYCPTIALRKVSFKPNSNSSCQMITNKLSIQLNMVKSILIYCQNRLHLMHGSHIQQQRLFAR